jgi:hypothetical protein
MKRLRGALAIIEILISALSGVAQKGVIRGNVVDEVGQPIQAAKVHAELHGVPMSKAIRYVESDESGAFAIDRLDDGTYDVNGKKEEDGYADTSFSFYAGKPVSVQITPDHPNPRITLKLGPKAGILGGTVRDALTGKPIPVGFMLRRVDNPTNFLSTSAPPAFRILIPASTDVTVEVSAPGYETWFYVDESSHFKPSPLRLESSAQMQLDILLQPKEKQSDQLRFLVPEGYVGWLRLECNVKSTPASSVTNGVSTYKLPLDGVLRTSSAMPDIGEKKDYFFYSPAGEVTPVPSDYWSGRGLIWGEYEGSRGGERSFLGFFVGSEEQYLAHQSPPIN